MKFSNFHSEEGKLTFEIKESSTAFANALRQVILEETPGMAISEVDVYENTATMFDEYIAHRLGMIPLSTNIKSYELAKKCCNGNCNKCSTTMTLEAQGPGTVYSKDIKPADKTVAPFYDNIPIIKLAENQKIKMEMRATLGLMKDHAKWQSALAFYKHRPIVKIDSKVELCLAAVDACPMGIIEKKGKKLEVTDENKCTECMECVAVCPGSIKVSHDSSEFIFTIESFNNLKPKDILNMALEKLEQKVDDLESQFKKL